MALVNRMKNRGKIGIAITGQTRTSHPAGFAAKQTNVYNDATRGMKCIDSSRHRSENELNGGTKVNRLAD